MSNFPSRGFVAVRETADHADRRYLRVWSKSATGQSDIHLDWSPHPEAATIFATEDEAISWVRSGRVVDGVLVGAGRAFLPGFIFRVESAA